MFPFPFSFIASVADIPVDRIANAEAMSFNGTDQYVSAGDFSLNANEGTVSAWIKSSNTSDFQMIVGKFVSGSRQVQFRKETNKKIRVILYKSSTVNSLLDSTATVSDDNWHHIAFTYNSSGINIYIDGSASGSNTTNITPVQTSTDDFIIGARNISAPEKFFSGQIDEVAVFNKALSGPKIQQIYDATAVVGGVPQTANLFTGGLSSSLVYWNRMGDS